MSPLQPSLFQRVDGGGRGDGDLGGQFEEFDPVLFGGVGHTAQGALAVDQFVFHFRDGGHVDGVDCQRASRPDLCQCERHNPPDGSKGDRSVEQFGWGIFCASYPNSAKFLGMAAVF